MTGRSVAVAVAILVLGLGAAGARAETAADATIAYRKAVMQVMEGHLKSLAEIAKGQVPYADDLAVHGAGLDAAAAMVLEAFTPQVQAGAQEKTTAKPEIWANFGRFVDLLRKTQSETAALKAAAASGDRAAVAARLPAVAEACKSCHDASRTK